MARFDRKWFNPLYFILNDILKDRTIRTVLVYGGKSSSKTISITQQLVKECYVRGSSSIAFRKESVIIPTTLKKSFNLALDSTWLFPAFETQDRRYLCRTEIATEAEIVLKGLDDSEKAKGVESYKYVYLDELNQFEQSEYEQINLSLRGIDGQKILASWNPVDENSWVKTALVDTYEWLPYKGSPQSLPCSNSFVHISKCGKVVLIKTTFPDNYWIVGSPDYKAVAGDRISGYGYRDDNLILEYEKLRTTNSNSHKVNVLGEWGKTVFGGEFLKCWRSERHTGLHEYNPELAVHLIFDENVNPYFPCGIFQIEEKKDEKNVVITKHIYLIHSIALKNPDNTVKVMGREIARKLRAWAHEGVVYVGGDPTSQKEDVKLEKGHDFFRLIIGELKEFNPRRTVLRSSPSVRMSADFFNSILQEQIYGLHFSVDKSCRVAILDYENTKEDKNGKVDKTVTRDPITKVSSQPYGHFVDLTRYFICFAFASDYEKYQRAGVETPISLGRRESKNRW